MIGRYGLAPRLLLALASAISGAAGAEAPLRLERFGVLYVGGREIPLTGARGGGGATQVVDQAPVHCFLPPAELRGEKPPVVMVPGMGLTSAIYLAPPDGREGWASLFVRGGYPVYVFDEPGAAVSGFDVGAFRPDDEGEVRGRFRLWSNEMVWRRWGFGPEPGVPFDDTQYPVERIDQLHRSLTPVASSGGRGRGGAPEAKLAALVDLLEQIGGAVLVVHSAAGPLGFEAARQRPDLVRGVVAVEATGYPTDPDDVEAHFTSKPFIAVFGDHFDTRPMQGRFDAAATTVMLIVAAGGDAELLHLPTLGVRGNSHLLMQDRNNADIAARILRRLDPATTQP